MYSYEERLKAVKLYIQYDRSYASVYRELGYPPSSILSLTINRGEIIVDTDTLLFFDKNPSALLFSP